MAAKKVAILTVLLAVVFATVSTNAFAEHSSTARFNNICTIAKNTTGLDLGDCSMIDVTKQTLTNDIAHYSLAFQVGPQAEDIIRVHRVVREHNNKPIKTDDAVFLLHGGLWGFEQAYLYNNISPNKTPEQSFAFYLASNDVDVWGMDFRWVSVSPDATDFSFMQDWGVSTYIGDIGVSLALARVGRLLTGSGPGKLNLLGWSYGAAMVYAYANAETQINEHFRQVKGIIPVDMPYKFDPADVDVRLNACGRLPGYQALYDSGVYNMDSSVVVVIGQLAAADPDGASPIVPGLTNRQVALMFAGASFVFEGDYPSVPFYHISAATFDEYGLPTDLIFTQEAFLLDALQVGHPQESMLLRVEMETLLCDEDDSPFDDYLDQITVPELYVGAGGGFGDYGLYVPSIVGSSDVTTLVVKTGPPEALPVEFGHGDTFLADDAQTLMWQPILGWLQTH